jgi:uncharacterized protein with GYD domain
VTGVAARGGKAVPLYVALVNYTDRGMTAVRESPRRLDAAKRLLEDMGGGSTRCT